MSKERNEGKIAAWESVLEWVESTIHCNESLVNCSLYVESMRAITRLDLLFNLRNQLRDMIATTRRVIELEGK
jgi:hypothetical protein